MAERPYSRYTRAKTWAALYSQHINAGYAIVPWSRTENSVDVINCREVGRSDQDLAKDTQRKAEELLLHEEAIARYYQFRPPLGGPQEDLAPSDQKIKSLTPPRILAEAIQAKRLRIAVVLAKSSDYYHYHIEDIPEINLVICGLHDSYLLVPVWEMNTNRRYRSRETAVALTDPKFNRVRCTQFGHSILLTAYAKGEPEAVSFVEQKLPERTRSRIKQKADDLQYRNYRGRPLAFRNAAKRQEVAEKIRQGVIDYHARKRA